MTASPYYVGNPFRIDALPTISGKTANLWYDASTGQVYRIV